MNAISAKPSLELHQEVSLDKRVDSNCYEDEADKADQDDSDDFDPLHPYASAPADSLEHAPESVSEMEPECHEPNDVQSGDPPVAEVVGQKDVRIVLIKLGSDLEELGHLHVSPELGKVEEDESEDHDTEYKHVA